MDIKIKLKNIISNKIKAHKHKTKLKGNRPELKCEVSFQRSL